MMKPHLKEVPGPSGIELIKMVWEFRRNPITALQKSSQKYGDIVAFRFGVETIYLLFHPDHIKHIFIDHYYYYSKQNALWVRLSPFLGQGLLTSEGDFWKKQRKLIQPTFHREHIAKLAESMQEPAQMMARQWQKKSDQSINVWIEMMRLTLQILGKTLLHVDFSEQASMIRQYIDEIVSHVNWQSKRIFLLPTKVPTLRNRRFLKALQSFDKIIYQMITSRRKLSQQPFDLLGLLLGIEDEKTREEMSNKQIRDELITFIFAGHETTANALAWAWYLIARHPDVQEKIHQELNVVLAGKTPGLAKLAQLTYLDAVLKESMRLYPPVWFLGRKVVQENQINGYRIPQGVTLMPSFYFTHRHKDFWQDPEAFKPERFLEQKNPEQHPYAYVPFGLGPRQCIGNRFATMEMQLIMATLLQKFKVKLDPHQKITLDPALTLRPKNGIKLLLENISPNE